MSSVTHWVTDETFEEEVLGADLPVLVDFWAEWCGPCDVVAPIVEEVAREFQGRVKVAKCNVDESPDTSVQYKIRSIPALLLFRNGQVVAFRVGALPRKQLVELLADHL